MNKLLLEVVKFTELPPRTRRVAGLGHVPVPELVEPHSDGGGESVTHHIKFVSDDGNTEVIHKVTQHVRRDGKPYIIPNTIRTDVYHKGTMSKKIHPMPEDEEGRQKRNLQIRGDIRTAIGVTRHIKNVIPELAKKYNAKEWRISATDPNSNVQQGRKASTYERVVGMIAKKHGARKRFLGVPLPGRVKPEKVTSTLISLKLDENAKTLIFEAIDFVRRTQDRPIPHRILDHTDKGGYSVATDHIYDGEDEVGNKIEITHTAVVHKRTVRNGIRGIIDRHNRRKFLKTNPNSIATSFKVNGKMSIPDYSPDIKGNSEIVKSVIRHVRSIVPQIAEKEGATHFMVAPADMNDTNVKRKRGIHASLLSRMGLPDQKPKKYGRNLLGVRIR